MRVVASALVLIIGVSSVSVFLQSLLLGQDDADHVRSVEQAEGYWERWGRLRQQPFRSARTRRLSGVLALTSGCIGLALVVAGRWDLSLS